MPLCPTVLVIGPCAALRVRNGALVVEHGEGSPEGKQTVRLDVDSPKPHTILFDSHGEFLTGEAIRWCARYGIGLVLPDGPGRMLTVLQSGLEASDGASELADIDPAVIKAQCAASFDKSATVAIAREIVRAKIEAEYIHIFECFHIRLFEYKEILMKIEAARTVAELLIVEAKAAADYWRAFRDVGLREAKNGNLPRSWLRFANRQKGAQFLGSKHASHPINAMLNYAYVVEAGRLAKALAARGLALQIGFLHADKKGRNSLVWDAIEPLRPAIDARVFSYIASREFCRSDFPQTSATTFRLARGVIGEMLDRVCLSEREINATATSGRPLYEDRCRSVAGAADTMLQLIERHAGGEHRLFKADLRRRKRTLENA